MCASKDFNRFDERCPCTDILDCKLPGFRKCTCLVLIEILRNLYPRNTDCAMARIIDFASPVGQKARSGGWNDLDMLEVGNGGMTHDEYGALF